MDAVGIAVEVGRDASLDPAGRRRGFATPGGE